MNETLRTHVPQYHQPSLPRMVPVLALKILYPGKPLCPRQATQNGWSPYLGDPEQEVVEKEIKKKKSLKKIIFDISEACFEKSDEHLSTQKEQRWSIEKGFILFFPNNSVQLCNKGSDHWLLPPHTVILANDLLKLYASCPGREHCL